MVLLVYLLVSFGEYVVSELKSKFEKRCGFYLTTTTKGKKKGGGGVQVDSGDLLPHGKKVKLQSSTELTQVVKEQ